MNPGSGLESDGGDQFFCGGECLYEVVFNTPFTASVTLSIGAYLNAAFASDCSGKRGLTNRAIALINPAGSNLSKMWSLQHPSYSSARAASDVQGEVVDWHPCRIGRGRGGVDAD